MPHILVFRTPFSKIAFIPLQRQAAYQTKQFQTSNISQNTKKILSNKLIGTSMVEKPTKMANLIRNLAKHIKKSKIIQNNACIVMNYVVFYIHKTSKR
jgi:hypothetical protein